MLDMIKVDFERFRVSLDRIWINSDQNSASKLRNLSSGPIRTHGVGVWAPEKVLNGPWECLNHLDALPESWEESKIRVLGIPCGHLNIDSNPTRGRSNNILTPDPRVGFIIQRVRTLESSVGAWKNFRMIYCGRPNGFRILFPKSTDCVTE